jgi:PAS domain S-box-containing protein
MQEAGVWKVLIVEDERIDREIYKILLRDSGHFQFECAECDSAACGLAKTAAWAPDCVLLDYHLPDMDGLEMLEALRGGNAHLPCAIIMLTARGGEDLAVKALKSGAMDYLPKGPALSDVLPHSVANAIERFQMQRRIEEQRTALEKSARRHQTLIEAIPHMVWMSDAEGVVEYANSQWFEYGGLGLGEGGPLGWDVLLHPDDRERSWAAWAKARESAAAFEIENRLKRADGSYRWHLVRAVPFRGAGQEIANWFGTCTEIESQKFAETVNLQKEKQHGIGQLAAGVAHDFNNLLVAILGGASLVMESLGPGDPAQDMLQNVVRAAERAAELTGKMLAYAGKGNMFIERTDLNQVVGETCEPLRNLLPKNIRFLVRCGRNLPSLTTDSRRLRQTLADLVWNAAEAIGEQTPGTIWVRTAVMAVREGSRSTVPPGKYLALEVRDTGCGMDVETQQRMFDPFFSTKFPGRGLGLAAVAGFVRSNGGEVRVESKPGRGSRFRILLPAALAEAQAGGRAR